MEDRALLQDLKDIRERREKREETATYPIVCDHIMFGTPFSIDAINLKVSGDRRHPKHDGNVYVCQSCELVFERGISEAELIGFHIVKRRKILGNIKSIKDR